ncbi:hypothetical protein H9639_04255 [Arthrobacter sp. Sa2CUA1]|uniref:Uncharacterized protein n=1 Tax=Arthrobacter gallicola TaxID=2762225 RepID=A0ABR8UQ53_9MICC|nr:hypothetical protein [Arthrobacter gallicola]MBD7994502.1 hypothetical protein [Arthrobacter gallicola]
MTATPVPPRGAALPPGIVWSAALLLAPFASQAAGAGSGTTTAEAWFWGAGTVLLVIVFPWVLVRTLDRRGDLRRSISRAGTGPVILGAGALCFMLLRLILWLDGPRELAAVVFAMMASYTLTLVLPAPRRPDWPALSLGAGVVILPVLAGTAIPGPGGVGAAAVLGALCAAALLLLNTARRRQLASAAAGAVVGGGLFLLLRAASG